MEQLFRLIGDPKDCRDLARLFPAGAPSVQKIEEEYYLQLSECDPLSKSTQVPEIAKSAIARLKTIAKLELGNFPQVEIQGVSKRDTATGQLLTYVNVTGKIEGKACTSADIKVRLSDGTVLKSNPNQVPPLVKALLKLTETDKGLDHALILYGKEKHDWPGLYKFLDAITQAFGGEQKLISQGFVTSAEIEQFKEPANRHRHGFAPGKPRENKRKEPAGPSKEMTLPEAEIWITNILINWVAKIP